LEKAALSAASLAQTITRARHHRRPAKKKEQAQKEELRSLASTKFEELLRTFLGRPHYEHVAKIARLVSGIPTDADYVKKVAKRGALRSAAGDTISRNHR
jgi:hypothetical protein